jgi:hypothetical protein
LHFLTLFVKLLLDRIALGGKLHVCDLSASAHAR